MVPIQKFMQLSCLALILSSAQFASGSRISSPPSHSQAGKSDKDKFLHWGPQYFLAGWLPTRSRRSEMDNRIDNFAAPPQQQSAYDPLSYGEEQSPEVAAVGDEILKEFVLFLTLKESGLLDLCMPFKRR